MYSVAIWAAVSTKSQADEDKISIEHQVRACRELVEKSGWHERACLVVPGHTRDILFLHDAAEQMPQMAELVRLAQEREINLVVAWHPNRLYRNEALGAQLREYLGVVGVQMTFVESPMPLVPPETFDYRTNMAARAAQMVFSFASASETANFVAKSQVGKRAVARRGRYLAPVAAYGYKKVSKGVIEAEPAEAAVVRMMYEMYMDKGMGFRTIAGALNEKGLTKRGRKWHHSAVRLILMNPVSYGFLRFGHRPVTRVPKDGIKMAKVRRVNPDAIFVKGQHEAILDPEGYKPLLRRVKQRLRLGRAAGKSKRVYLLSGVLKCPHCNGNLSGRTVNDKSGVYCYYVCCHSGRYGKHKHYGVRAEPIEQRAQEILQSILERPELYGDAVDTFLRRDGAEQRMDDVEQILDDLRQRKRRLDEAYLGGALSLASYRETNLSLEAQIASIEEERANLEDETELMRGREALLDSLRGFFVSGDLLVDVVSRREAREIVQSIFREIEITPDGEISSWQLHG